MADTRIEWAQKVWNPVTGCTKISSGCQNCYAERMANRLRGQYGYPAKEPFRVTVRPKWLEEPVKEGMVISGKYHRCKSRGLKGGVRGYCVGGYRGFKEVINCLGGGGTNI